MKTSTIHRSGAGATAIAALSATLALTAPFAAADTVSNGITILGSNYSVGNVYTVAFDVTQTGAEVQVFDQLAGASSTTQIGSSTVTSGSRQSFPWIPVGVGSHQIWATVTLNSATLPEIGPITVSVAAPDPNSGSAKSFPVLGNLISSLSSLSAK
ncbi:hypothetical protein [Nocardia sp. NBC_00511]|uniref:hypothetical protein n=1 Tax=Nocardia sp. NBC_00511 TaxID=2903591 RepID=UPI0030DF2BB0